MSSQGPNYPGSISAGGLWAAAGTASSLLDGIDAAADGKYIQEFIDDSNTDTVTVGDFGFSIPSMAAIIGILVEWGKGSTRDATAHYVVDHTVTLSLGGTDKADTSTKWGSNFGNAVYGGSADLWGLGSITPSQVNDSSFSVTVSGDGTNTNGSALISYDYIRVTIYYTDNPVPGQPSLSVGRDSTNPTTALDLAWSTPSGSPTGYQILRATSLGATFSVLVANTGSTSTSYTDSGLTSATEWAYEVAGINANGTGTPSAPAAWATEPDVPNLLVTPDSTSSVDLGLGSPSMGTNSTFAGFLLRVETPYGSGNFSFPISIGPSVTNYEVTGLAPDTTYGFKVAAAIQSTPGDYGAQIIGAYTSDTPGTTFTVNAAWRTTLDSSDAAAFVAGLGRASIQRVNEISRDWFVEPFAPANPPRTLGPLPGWVQPISQPTYLPDRDLDLLTPGWWTPYLFNPNYPPVTDMGVAAWMQPISQPTHLPGSKLWRSNDWWTSGIFPVVFPPPGPRIIPFVPEYPQPRRQPLTTYWDVSGVMPPTIEALVSVANPSAAAWRQPQSQPNFNTILMRPIERPDAVEPVRPIGTTTFITPPYSGWNQAQSQPSFHDARRAQQPQSTVLPQLNWAVVVPSMAWLQPQSQPIYLPRRVDGSFDMLLVPSQTLIVPPCPYLPMRPDDDPAAYRPARVDDVDTATQIIIING